MTTRSKFYLGTLRAWWRGKRCFNCRRLRSLGWWRNAWDKHTEDYFCAECLADKLAIAEAKWARLEP